MPKTTKTPEGLVQKPTAAEKTGDTVPNQDDIFQDDSFDDSSNGEYRPRSAPKRIRESRNVGLLLPISTFFGRSTMSSLTG
jgi:hypothetical protein